jgi:hypothetical protein
VEELEERRAPTTIYWNPPNPNTNNSWETAANWQGGVKPGANDTADLGNANQANGASDCQMSANETVSGLILESGYSANSVLFNSGGLTLTVTSVMTLTDGKINFGDSSATLYYNPSSTASGTWTNTSFVNSASTGGTIKIGSFGQVRLGATHIVSGQVVGQDLSVTCKAKLDVEGTFFTGIAGFPAADSIDFGTVGSLVIGTEGKFQSYDGGIAGKSDSLNNMSVGIENYGTIAVGDSGNNSVGWLNVNNSTGYLNNHGTLDVDNAGACGLAGSNTLDGFTYGLLNDYSTSVVDLYQSTTSATLKLAGTNNNGTDFYQKNGEVATYGTSDSSVAAIINCATFRLTGGKIFGSDTPFINNLYISSQGSGPGNVIISNTTYYVDVIKSQAGVWQNDRIKCDGNWKFNGNNTLNVTTQGTHNAGDPTVSTLITAGSFTGTDFENRPVWNGHTYSARGAAGTTYTITW